MRGGSPGRLLGHPGTGSGLTGAVSPVPKPDHLRAIENRAVVSPGAFVLPSSEISRRTGAEVGTVSRPTATSRAQAYPFGNSPGGDF